MKKLIAALCVTGLLVSAVPIYAEPVYAEHDDEVDGTAVLLDVIVVRPLGVVSIVIGAGVFIVSLPFTVPTRSVGRAAEKLLVEPVKFTFGRPIGEVRD